MYHETSEDTRRRASGARGAFGDLPGAHRPPVDVTTSRGSGMGLLIAALVLLGFIALIALLPRGESPVSGPPGLTSGTPQAAPTENPAASVQTE
ncbi:MAG: hypothetical protein MRY75_01235 [Marivita sp.]|uniref:hypothetical protein n=1 Tax=Marivita sp. TaxID=2003365 RepID=UPI0025C04582|nr:hypothetical protein [Marivita sp.]MCI5109150.1 hypothetical protein [Marivita sp.]